jgi:hypothetical protein
MTVKALANFTLNVVTWCLALVGCVWTTASAADLYMILVGGAHPGDVIYLDTLAPTTRQAAVGVLVGISLIAASFLLRSTIRRWYASR